MTAYQLKIEIEQSQPLIWRRVLVPADLTFAGLHSVIQNCLNFQGHHHYTFNLPDENLKITTDPEAHQLHQEYLSKKEELEKVLGALGTSFARQQLEALRTVVKNPEEAEIGPYLEKRGVLHYSYDLEYPWELKIILEETVSGEGLSYPQLLAGAESAPPEDVKGPSGFYQFLGAWQDPEHPDHGAARAWGEGQGFREYDPQQVQERLKKV